MGELTFTAKVDTWFLATFWGGGALMLIGAALFGRLGKRGVVGVAVLAIAGLLFLGIGFVARNASYTLTEDGFLDAHGWPFDGRMMHVSEIRVVSPSSDPRASRAASLDRLRIDYAGDRTVFIAVEDEAAFLDAVATRAPQARVSGR